MVVVDSSALIPLSWVGRLDLVEDIFDDIHTTRGVSDEVLVEGKRGTAALETFLEDVTLHPTPEDAEAVAELDGVATTDAEVGLLAEAEAEPLLANDRALIEVARSHRVDTWWVTTLLLKATKDGILALDEASDLLYDLVDEGMNPHPRVYAKVQRALDGLK